jgi:hypothetical protein
VYSAKCVSVNRDVAESCAWCACSGSSWRSWQLMCVG